ncbi:MAG: hypothetical protein AAF656_08840 [Planctomycetota bacterium]
MKRFRFRNKFVRVHFGRHVRVARRGFRRVSRTVFLPEDEPRLSVSNGKLSIAGKGVRGKRKWQPIAGVDHAGRRQLRRMLAGWKRAHRPRLVSDPDAVTASFVWYTPALTHWVVSLARLVLAIIGVWALGFVVLALAAWWRLEPDERVYLWADLRRPLFLQFVALFSVLHAVPFVGLIWERGLPLRIDVGRRRIVIRRGLKTARCFRPPGAKFSPSRTNGIISVIDPAGQTLACASAAGSRTASQIAEQINAVIGHESRNASVLTPPPVRCP